jgi:hypothetical protein
MVFFASVPLPLTLFQIAKTIAAATYASLKHISFDLRRHYHLLSWKFYSIQQQYEDS